MITDKKVGLYVHIPFCVSKCNYCDFCSFPERNFVSKDEYIDSLVAEINSYTEENMVVDTIFFGGGTPSILTPSEFERITRAIFSSFSVSSDVEFTIEANPKTLSREKLCAYKALGVNRISIGMQSTHEKELKKLGRIHSFDDFLETIRIVRETGIENINVDVMYGIPEQTKESFEETINKVLALKLPHISVYGLILEEGTPFFDKRDSLALPTDDDECDMYYLASEILGKNGYKHYEISNYCLNGFECLHNIKYWHCDEYIGVGLSAYSFYGGRRFGNTRDYKGYVGQKDVLQYDELLDKSDEAYEYVMLGLRLKDGISLSEYKERFGVDFLDGREKVITELSNLGLVNLSEDTLSLTERGFYVSNSILIKLL